MAFKSSFFPEGVPLKIHTNITLVSLWYMCGVPTEWLYYQDTFLYTMFKFDPHDRFPGGAGSSLTTFKFLYVF